jgi:hypothetical protein
MVAVGLTAVAALLTACGPELGPIWPMSTDPLTILPETSDPSVVRVGSEYFVYGSDNSLRAPVTRTSRLVRPYTQWEKDLLTTEAMPTKPAWAARDRQLWAPTVAPFGGQWVMFFGADRVNPPQPWNAQCIGRAWASGPLGPFVPEVLPFTCGINGVGGALDPELYREQNGRTYLHAAFGDTLDNIRGIELDANANPIGDWVVLLGRRQPWEYHFIENPSMMYDPVRRNWLLSYSAGKWFEAGYSTGIARCSTPLGPCTSHPNGPWISSRGGRTGTGGLSFFTDPSGNPWAIYASFPAGRETTNGGRSASVVPIVLSPMVSAGPVVK